MIKNSKRVSTISDAERVAAVTKGSHYDFDDLMTFGLVLDACRMARRRYTADLFLYGPRDSGVKEWKAALREGLKELERTPSSLSWDDVGDALVELNVGAALLGDPRAIPVDGPEAFSGGHRTRLEKIPTGGSQMNRSWESDYGK